MWSDVVLMRIYTPIASLQATQTSNNVFTGRNIKVRDLTLCVQRLLLTGKHKLDEIKLN